MTNYDIINSPVGRLLLVAVGEKLVELRMLGLEEEPAILETLPTDWRHQPDLTILKTARQQLEEFFAGERKKFKLEIELTGTPFSKAVWQALQAIPHGQTVSYQDIAMAVGSPRAVRAVGTAVGRNPLAIILPCHRVLPKSGGIGQYGGGPKIKEWLVSFERGQQRL